MLCSRLLLLVLFLFASSFSSLPKPSQFLISFNAEGYEPVLRTELNTILTSNGTFDPLTYSLPPRRNAFTMRFHTSFVVLSLATRADVDHFSERISPYLLSHPSISEIQPEFAYSRQMLQASTSPTSSRSSFRADLPTKLNADVLWSLNYRGQGVKIAIFDTGISRKRTSQQFSSIQEVINFTTEKNGDDLEGHGTYVAGLIAARGAPDYSKKLKGEKKKKNIDSEKKGKKQKEKDRAPETLLRPSSACPGFAPDTELYIFKVFDSVPFAYTSWFLDAFNYAMRIGVDIINLSIGGPDSMDQPFLDKVNEVVANGILVVSAIGNRGPLYGTLHNPGDMPSVLGIGGLTYQDDIAYFSSRGTTTQELKRGYGLFKPDLVAYGQKVRASGRHGGCVTKTGTSVSAPVVTGSLALLFSAARQDGSHGHVWNPAAWKQILTEGAVRLPDYSIFEQGSGKFDLIHSYKILRKYVPRVTFYPPEIDLLDCPYMMPFCHQKLFHTAMPLILNITILNPLGVTSFISSDTPPSFVAGRNGQLLDVSVNFDTPNLWPWGGQIALMMSVKQAGKWFQGPAEGSLKVVIETPISNKMNHSSVVNLPIRVKIVRPPPRNKRILWSQFHNIQYPPGYIPKDVLEDHSKALDMTGDHPHTNYLDFFSYLIAQGYTIDVLTDSLTEFNAEFYGTLMLMDTEEEFTTKERNKLFEDVTNHGLSVLVLADWYNIDMMKKLQIYNENTHSTWIPATGGANVPALNGLLSPFGIALSDSVFHGDFSFDPPMNTLSGSYLSGSSILLFPKKSYIGYARLTDQVYEMIPELKETDHSNRLFSERRRVPILGLAQSGQGRLVVFGDSNCLDSSYIINSHQFKDCFNFGKTLLLYAMKGRLMEDLANGLAWISEEDGTFVDPFSKMEMPKRPPWNDLAQYSAVPEDEWMEIPPFPHFDNDSIFFVGGRRISSSLSSGSDDDLLTRLRVLDGSSSQRYWFKIKIVIFVTIALIIAIVVMVLIKRYRRSPSGALMDGLVSPLSSPRLIRPRRRSYQIRSRRSTGRRQSASSLELLRQALRRNKRNRHRHRRNRGTSSSRSRSRSKSPPSTTDDEVESYIGNLQKSASLPSFLLIRNRRFSAPSDLERKLARLVVQQQLKSGGTLDEMVFWEDSESNSDYEQEL